MVRTGGRTQKPNSKALSGTGITANHPTCKSRKPFLVVLPAVAETTKLSVHFVINSGQELEDMLSYVKLCHVNTAKHKTLQILLRVSVC
jgi:hypothetical protein